MSRSKPRFTFKQNPTSIHPEYAIIDKHDGSTIGHIHSYGHLRRPRILFDCFFSLSVPELHEITDKADAMPSRSARKD